MGGRRTLMADPQNNRVAASENDVELLEWLASADDVLERRGPDFVRELIRKLETHVHQKGVRLPFTARTPYINSIPLEREPAYPGDYQLERRIKSIIRWNAMAMV